MDVIFAIGPATGPWTAWSADSGDQFSLSAPGKSNAQLQGDLNACKAAAMRAPAPDASHPDTRQHALVDCLRARGDQVHVPGWPDPAPMAAAMPASPAYPGNPAPAVRPGQGTQPAQAANPAAALALSQEQRGLVRLGQIKQRIASMQDFKAEDYSPAHRKSLGACQGLYSVELGQEACVRDVRGALWSTMSLFSVPVVPGSRLLADAEARRDLAEAYKRYAALGEAGADRHLCSAIPVQASPGAAAGPSEFFLINDAAERTQVCERFHALNAQATAALQQVMSAPHTMIVQSTPPAAVSPPLVSLPNVQPKPQQTTHDTPQAAQAGVDADELGPENQRGQPAKPQRVPEQRPHQRDRQMKGRGPTSAARAGYADFRAAQPDRSAARQYALSADPHTGRAARPSRALRGA